MSDEIIYVPDIVPVFPLADIVLFPRTMIPLHIFEPRYRAMIADALDSDQTIALALLKPGYGPLYYTRRAPIHRVIGVGRIAAHEQVDDGNYNLLLRGIARAEIEEELSDRPYRVARITQLDTYCTATDREARRLRTELKKTIRADEAVDEEIRRRWIQIIDADLALDDLADLIGGSLPAEAELRQLLLEEPDATSRLGMVTDHLRVLSAMARARRRADRTGGSNVN